MSFRALITNLKAALNEGGYAIGAGGLEKTGGDKIALQKDTVYYLGASSSPSMVLVTSVSDDRVEYLTYPFGKSGKKAVAQTWVFRDLAQKGMATWLKSGMAQYQPELAKSIQALLDGKKVKPNGDDYKPLQVKAKGTGKLDDDTEWRTAENYGSVGKNGDEYVIDTNAKGLAKLKKDKNFEVVSVEDR